MGQNIWIWYVCVQRIVIPKNCTSCTQRVDELCSWKITCTCSNWIVISDVHVRSVVLVCRDTCANLIFDTFQILRSWFRTTPTRTATSCHMTCWRHTDTTTESDVMRRQETTARRTSTFTFIQRRRRYSSTWRSVIRSLPQTLKFIGERPAWKMDNKSETPSSKTSTTTLRVSIADSLPVKQTATSLYPFVTAWWVSLKAAVVERNHCNFPFTLVWQMLRCAID